MSSTSSLPIAEVADRHRRYFAYIMLLLGLVNVGLIAEELWPDQAFLAEGLQIASVIGMFYFLVRIVSWKLRNLSADVRHLYLDDDGFMAGAVARAHVFSWTLTFVFIAVIGRLDNTLAGVPPFVLLNTALVVMTASFGLAFLWLARSDDESSGA